MQVISTNTTEWEAISSVLDAFPTGVVICNAQGDITHVNMELLRQFGYHKHELQSRPIETLLPEEYREVHARHLRAYMKNPEKRNMGTGRELYGQRKDGSKFPIEIGLNPIATESGQQIIATVADISHRRQLETNFKNIVEAAPVGMVIADANGRITLTNKHLLSLFGYTQEELQGQAVEILLPKRHHEHHRQYRQDYLKAPEPRSMGPGRDLTGRHKYGTEIPVEVGLNPIETEDGLAVIAAVIDVSERKKIELSLRQANADLDEFTYVASHDLKSPLRGIGNLIEWIEEDLGERIPEAVHNNLERITSRIRHMEKLIEDLLSYARAARKNEEFTDLNIKELIDEVIGLIEVPEGFNISVASEIDTIQSPKTPLETVLRNLINNAIKHHDRDHGEIRIEVDTQNAYCVFSVIDDGPGVPSGAQERIFKLFQTLSSDHATHSGVGLAVSKRLIEAHDGRIEVYSQDNERGTRFRFWWPRFTRRDLDV